MYAALSTQLQDIVHKQSHIQSNCKAGHTLLVNRQQADQIQPPMLLINSPTMGRPRCEHLLDTAYTSSSTATIKTLLPPNSTTCKVGV